MKSSLFGIGAALAAAFVCVAWPRTASGQWSSDASANLSVADGNGEQVQPKIAAAPDGSTYISWFDAGTTSFRFDTWTWSGTAWTNAGQFQPGARSRHAMAYDSVRNRTVVFGGIGAAGVYSDTWEWNNAAWTQVNVSGPSARESHAMVYDVARGVVLLFGGVDGASTLQGDTWTFDGTAWTQLSPATSPGARKGHSLAYDSVRQLVVLFGGEEGGGKQADTWEWNGTTWTQIAIANPPSPRSFHATAFDPVSSKVLLFGGSDSASAVQNDTWLYDGTNWAVQAPATNPAARSGHAMANSFTAGGVRVVIYGGNTGTFNTQGMFEWSGTNWASKTSGPSARNNPAMAYDTTAAKTVLFGGTETGGYDVRLQRLNGKGVEQWAHNGLLIADRSVSSTVDYGMVCDADGNALVAFNDDRFSPAKITVQKVSPAGALLWNGAMGVQAGDGSTTGSPPSIAVLSDGGYGVIWNNTISPVGTIRQKLSSSGAVLWGANGMTQNDTIAPQRPLQACDVQAADLGGMIACFVRCTGTNCVTSNKQLYIQKYDSSGAPVWNAAAPLALMGATASIQTGYFPRFLSDGAGGAVLGFYETTTNARNAYIQHVLSDGTLKFPSPVSNVGPTNPATRIRVGAGLAYDRVTGEYYLVSPETDASTQAQNSVFVQKYDALGARQWGDSGVTLLAITNTTQPSFVQAQVAGDGVGVSYMKTTSATTRVVAAARVNAEQSVVWDILAASNGAEDKSRLTSGVNACGDQVLAFGNGSTGGTDIRAQNVRLDGTLGNPPPMLGDLDCDGVVDVPDIGPFIQAQLDPPAYHLSHPCCDINMADMNVDLAIDGIDIADFVTALMNP